MLIKKEEKKVRGTRYTLLIAYYGRRVSPWGSSFFGGVDGINIFKSTALFRDGSGPC